METQQASSPDKPRDVVLSVSNVKKRIGKRTIIKGISFEVYAGEIFGFLGPNGSGKTTTIRMLVDLIRPTEGTIRICGYDVAKDHNKALQHVGAIVENPELYGYLTGWENLEHFARMLPGVGEERIREVVEIVGMDARIHDKVKTYSLGMRQRLGIAQALLNRPRLLILDEPTNGLDPQGIKELRAFIRRLADQGLSLFVSSHLLSEIQQMCDRVAIIARGELIRTGEVAALIDESVSSVVWSVGARRAAVARELLEAGEGVQVLPSGGRPHGQREQAHSHGGALDGDAESSLAGAEQPPGIRAIVTRMSQAAIPEWTRTLAAAGVDVFGIEIKHPTLEDLFLELTEGEHVG